MLGYRIKRKSKDGYEYAKAGAHRFTKDLKSAKIWSSARTVRAHLSLYNGYLTAQVNNLIIEMVELNVVNELTTKEFKEYNEPK